MGELSARQQAIIDFIKRYQNEKGYPPAIREIGDAVGLMSSSTVHGHLARLEKKGLIKRNPSTARTIELTDTQENSGAFFANDSGKVLYFVIEDDGMIKSQIKKGDTVLVRPGNVANGEIALVSLYGRKMVRRLYKDGKQMLLESEVKTERSIFTTEATVIGKVIGVYSWINDGAI
ncbi:LexA family protein [Aneurinibacillus aneurinilyticus]|uniref:Repressor LexA n=1 Tax=Aneurinibacillus aneurinilyticus ATCC 12856 TaxID=649747 RepID=U1X8G7_ANEAE|nr:S24 family peptidase [Aneurinibacillus aneurinilyticus]ERI10823.1 repressor LexA [Aneurinibacillus aneurinilyticus ATCC 12856]MED0705912.1 S24 family peptidase [Aneurinibacillus aneurinilyticus]MED0722699.1 S24 family peptidase [Aneurinibacillus aneurinilyticus]MED0731381.1 S24 family peptidase [Aneurinibacillus aneurinilyticus]MED0740137.1 S24 family peptidase [Aneurinibacillus aneurinilyticus]